MQPGNPVSRPRPTEISDVLSKSGLRRFHILSYAYMSLLALSYLTIYVVTVNVPNEVLVELLHEEPLGSLLRKFPLDYTLFLQSINPTAAPRVWFVEFFSLLISALLFIGVFGVTLYLIRGERVAICWLADQSVFSKNNLILICGTLALLAFYHFSWAKVVNGNYRTSIGPNDGLLLFFMMCLFFLAHLLWALEFLLISVLAKAARRITRHSCN